MGDTIWTGEKQKALAALTPEQMDDYHFAMTAMKGLTTYQAAQAVGGHGIDWRGCPKWHIAVNFAQRGSLFDSSRMGGWTRAIFSRYCEIKRDLVAQG